MELVIPGGTYANRHGNLARCICDLRIESARLNRVYLGSTPMVMLVEHGKNDTTFYNVRPDGRWAHAGASSQFDIVREVYRDHRPQQAN